MHRSFTFDNSFARDLAGMYEPWSPALAPAPHALVINERLAAELGVDPAWLASPEGVDVLVGNTVPAGATPIAQGYSGHQFGGFSPRLGDGRALLLGEVTDCRGNVRDLHLKGSGRTPFSRGGDGKAAVGPMLREYIIGEAMHALGIPTTRALAVVATGDEVVRESVLPGAVLVRVAASHLRIGSFQYAATRPDTTMVRRVADHAIARHYPHLADAPDRYLELLREVVHAQAELVARWMLVGFIHGVMNTDNTTISGETIDYGPCAFLDRFDPATVFSSIDHGGRYAFGNQPKVIQWNLARLAEPLLPLIHADGTRGVELAMGVLEGFAERFHSVWMGAVRAKVGLAESRDGDTQLVNDLYELLDVQQADHTLFFRKLSGVVIGDDAPLRALLAEPTAFDEWGDRWADRMRSERRQPAAVVSAMNAVNPLYIARNHLVEEALAAASVDGDLGPLRRLVAVLEHPFDERDGAERYAQPAPRDAGRYQTFCGT